MEAKPLGWAARYAEAFELGSVVDRYGLRPPYPAETFDVLTSLVDAANSSVLDAGCGLGDLARPLAQRGHVVDAVDRSRAMLARARTMAGGDASTIRWVLGGVEDAPLAEAYGLIVCGDSIHWFDWPVVFERFHRCLAPRSHLALVSRDWRLGTVDRERLGRLYGQHSANRHFRALDPVTELERRGLFQRFGQLTTPAVAWRPTLTDVVAFHHSQSGFALEKMRDPAGFDRALAEEITRSLDVRPDGRYDLSVKATITWGRPRPASALEVLNSQTRRS
jgi:SAM-dependent methyltransferase